MRISFSISYFQKTGNKIATNKIATTVRNDGNMMSGAMKKLMNKL